MKCIYCTTDTNVYNSRVKIKNPSVWRRRRCQACVAQFTTLELPDYTTALTVEGTGGKLYPLSRDKLYLSVHRSLAHRSDAIQAATELTATILGRLLRTKQAVNGMITMRSIADAAHLTLKRYDPLAAHSYRAYHQKLLKK